MRGRPKKEVVRNIRCNIRLSKEDSDMLGYIRYKTGLSRSEIIREAIRRYYNLLKYVE